MPTEPDVHSVISVVLSNCRRDFEVRASPQSGRYFDFLCQDGNWQVAVRIDTHTLNLELRAWLSTARQVLGAEMGANEVIAALISLHIAESLQSSGPDDDPDRPRSTEMVVS